MNEPLDTLEKQNNITEFSVFEISNALKRTVEDAFSFVRVRGEISGYRGPHASGHAYFALKDDKARLEAVIWRGVMGKLRFLPEEGMEVIATGKLTTYPGSSKYQIVIEALEPAGAGALMALLEERKKKLAAEGLFEAARKQLLPFMPKVIGVVTSPTGAVIRDIIHRISDRFPLHILVWPVRVQGETSGAEVASAVYGFNALPQNGPIPRPDLLIVARGGGSLEDLWGFNDEVVVRAVGASDIPVISAVGHETDWTLIDLAADQRAPTPTGAAEMAVPVKVDLEASLATLGARLKTALSRRFEFASQRLLGVGRALPTQDQLLALPRRRFDEAAGRLSRGLMLNLKTKHNRFDLFAARLTPAPLLRIVTQGRNTLKNIAARLNLNLNGRRERFTIFAARLTAQPLVRLVEQNRKSLLQLTGRLEERFIRLTEKRKERLQQLERLLHTVSYESILARGFALVLDGANVPVKQAADIDKGEALTLKFIDGSVSVVADGAAKTPTQRVGKKPPSDNESGPQGTLF